MRWSFEEDINFYSKNGFDRIGICRVKANELGVEHCRTLLEEAGIQVSSYGCCTFVSDISGPSLTEQVWQARKDIEDAATLGADCVILHTGGRGRHLRKNRFCVANKVIDLLLPQAEEHGVKIAIEPLTIDPVSRKCYSHVLQDCIELIEAYQSAEVGLALDLFHVGNAFQDIDSLWFGKNVFLTQLSDFRGSGCSRQRCPMGTGDLRLDDFCRFMDDTGYEGVFEFELHGEFFDLISYQQTVANLAATVTQIPDSASVEFESIKA